MRTRVWPAALVLIAGCQIVFGLERPDGRESDTISTDVASSCTTRGNPETCSVTGLVCAGTAEATKCGDTCWVRCVGDIGVDEITAAGRCTLWGGSLAPLQSQTDVACLTTKVSPDRVTWIGLVQRGNPQTPELGWSWNGDGCALNVVNWTPGQPDDGSDRVETAEEQCAYMSTGGATPGSWQDTPCERTIQAFVCRSN